MPTVGVRRRDLRHRPSRAYQYDASYAVEDVEEAPLRPAGDRPAGRSSPDPAVGDVVASGRSSRARSPSASSCARRTRARRGSVRPRARRRPRSTTSVNFLCWGKIDEGTKLIDRHPNVRFVLDHIGILQPRVPPAPPQPWADLPKVLALAQRPKRDDRCSGACVNCREGALSVPGHLGSSRESVRRLGLRAMSCGAPTGSSPFIAVVICSASPCGASLSSINSCDTHCAGKPADHQHD